MVPAADIARADADQPLRRQLQRSRLELRLRSEGTLAVLRVAGAAAFLGIALALGLGAGLPDWRSLLPVLAGYAAFSALLLYGVRARRAAEVPASGQVAKLWISMIGPSLDVLIVFVLQHQSLPLSPHPAGVAGWTLGVFVMLVLFASLTLRTGMIALTAAIAWCGEALLQHQAGVHAGAIVASGVILAMAAAVTAFAARQLEELVVRTATGEVARRLERERNQQLERAAAEVRAAHEALGLKHGELMRAQQRAEAFSQLMVHDLKGPLTSVLALLSLTVSNLKADPEVVEDLNIAIREGKRMLGMVQDLLAISRLEEGALRVEPREQPIVPILEAIAATHGSSAEQQGTALAVRGERDMVGLFDADLLHRVLENLVVNALRYTGRGQAIELGADAAESELVLTVANNGKPIAPERRAALFQKLAVQAPGQPHNFGLGLTLCRLVAEAHGGRISLEDLPGWNVAFVVRLPRTAKMPARSVV